MPWDLVVVAWLVGALLASPWVPHARDRWFHRAWKMAPPRMSVESHNAYRDELWRVWRWLGVVDLLVLWPVYLWKLWGQGEEPAGEDW